MNTRHIVGYLAAAVAVAILVQILAPGSGLVAVVAGLILVAGGTLLTAMLSHPGGAVMDLWRLVASRRRSPAAAPDPEAHGIDQFLRAANLFRRGDIRPAERVARQIAAPLLRRGTLLVLDGLPRDQVHLALQRQVAEERDRLRQPVDLLRAMSSYAPAFGMLGTLLGLVQMLFGLGTGELSATGAAMGFAMLTTVYGLMLANLLFKPLASQLDQRGRASIGARITQMQAVLMLCDRQHPDLIREMLDDAEPAAGRAQAAPHLQLVRAHA